jgi:hypothetical protein
LCCAIDNKITNIQNIVLDFNLTIIFYLGLLNRFWKQKSPVYLLENLIAIPCYCEQENFENDSGRSANNNLQLNRLHIQTHFYFAADQVSSFYMDTGERFMDQMIFAFIILPCFVLSNKAIGHTYCRAGYGFLARSRAMRN